MKFRKDGADIPCELIDSARKGEVTFFCGAGVSHFAAKMPLFGELTRKIYCALGEINPKPDKAGDKADRDDAEGLGDERVKLPAEEENAFKLGDYEQTLYLLERRISHPRFPSSKVRDAAYEILNAENERCTSVHMDLLNISIDRERRPRIITTNFDTLFERAAAKAYNAPTSGGVPSYDARLAPGPGRPYDHGIIHLHGRVSDKKLRLNRTELVLTMADFGAAYIRDGWASRYVEERMRVGTLVFIGYSAEDTMLRLLLPTLAERARALELKESYAIYVPDRQRNKLHAQGDGDVAAAWESKGIRPIEFYSHEQMYDSLAEWARLMRQPEDYRSEKLRLILGINEPTGGEGE